MAEFLGYSVSLLLLLSGTALVVAEAFAPGAHFIVIGIALLVAGIVGLLLPSGLGVLAPLIMAGVVLVTGLASFYAYREFDFYGGKGTDQTSDSDSLRGSMGRVTERVTPSDGEVKLENGGFNPYYRARSMDGEIPEGTEVMVIDPGGGNVITVEPVSGGVDEIDRELARGRANSAPADEAVDGLDASDTERSDDASDTGRSDDASDTERSDDASDTERSDDASDTGRSDDEREFETDPA